MAPLRPPAPRRRTHPARKAADHAVPRRVLTPRLPLFLGIFLLLLTVWKGEGGHKDQGEYLDDAVNLWTRGDMSLPKEIPTFDQVAADFEALEPTRDEIEEYLRLETKKEYHHYAVGLQVISGPLVLAGGAVERMTNGTIGQRAVAALMVPILAALACLLIYEIGRSLGASPRASVWAAVVFGVGSPLLTFSRLYFTEVAVVFFVLLAVWAFLRATSDADAGSFEETGWWLLAGAGLAGVTACHYGEVVTSAILYVAMAARILAGPGAWRTRLLKLRALTIVPALVVCALVWMNVERFGTLFPAEAPAEAADTRAGYTSDVADLRLQNIPENLQYAGTWMLRVPWALAAMVALGFLLKREMAGVRRERLLMAALLGATVIQCAFWTCYACLGFSPLRYLEPVTALAAVGLIVFGQRIVRRWPRWGLIVGGGVLIAWNLGFFIFGRDDHARTFFYKDGVEGYVWYMRKFAAGQLESHGSYGTPMGAVQWTMLVMLLISGAALIGWATRLATNQMKGGPGHSPGAEGTSNLP